MGHIIKELKTKDSEVFVTIWNDGDISIEADSEGITLTQSHFKEITGVYQDYLIDQIINTSDEEILAMIGTPGYPSQDDIDKFREITKKTVAKARQKRINNEI